MKFELYKISGWEEAIMSLRMSQGKFYSLEKAQQIQDLVYAVTNKKGWIATIDEYRANLLSLGLAHYVHIPYSGVHWCVKDNVHHAKITGNYSHDVDEFKRLLGLTMNNAMGAHDHHTLMKYIDVTFFTDELHRGAQDDLDAHAMGFNNRITRFSTRLAAIDEQKISEWYEGKIIPFHDANMLIEDPEYGLPQEIEHNGDIFKYTPFGYVLDKYADMPIDSPLRKDVVRGLMHLAMPSSALWKTDLWNLRYVYYRRGQLTKAHPELRDGMEQLADQIEANVPVFGEHFRHEFTDSGKWEHMHKVKTITLDEWKEYNRLKEQLLGGEAK